MWSPQDDGSGEGIQCRLILANISCQQIVDHCSAEQIVSQVPCQALNADAGGQLRSAHSCVRTGEKTAFDPERRLLFASARAGETSVSSSFQITQRSSSQVMAATELRSTVEGFC